MSIHAPSGEAVRPLIYNLDLAGESFEISSAPENTLVLATKPRIRKMLDMRNTVPIINGIACRPSPTADTEIMEIPGGTRKLRGSCRGGREIQLIDFTPLGGIIFVDCTLVSHTDLKSMDFSCGYDLTARPFLMFLFGTILLRGFSTADTMFAPLRGVSNIELNGVRAKFGNRHAAWTAAVWDYPRTARTATGRFEDQRDVLEQSGDQPFVVLFKRDGVDCRIQKSTYTLGSGTAVFRDDSWTYDGHPKIVPGILADDDTGAMPAYSAHVREKDLVTITKGTPVERLSGISRSHPMSTHTAFSYPTWFPHHRPLGTRQYSMIDIYRIP